MERLPVQDWVFPGMTDHAAYGTGDVAFRVLRALRAEEAAARRAAGGVPSDPSSAA